MYARKTNIFDSVIIMSVGDFLHKSPPLSSDFQQNANEVDFILKSVYIII